MVNPGRAFAKLVVDAIDEFGWNREAIERYVFDRIDRMDGPESEQIKRELELILAAPPPGFREDDPQ